MLDRVKADLIIEALGLVQSLIDVAEEERTIHRHVVEVQQVGSVRVDHRYQQFVEHGLLSWGVRVGVTRGASGASTGGKLATVCATRALLWY